jgi:hypothetical protein
MIYVFETHPQYTAISMVTMKEKAEKNPTKKTFLLHFYINVNLERVNFSVQHTNNLAHLVSVFPLRRRFLWSFPFFFR